MKAIITVALIGLIAAASAEPKCPTNLIYEKNIVFPNPKNIGLYYRCRNGSPVLTSCPSGLFFDEELLTCKYPLINKIKPMKLSALNPPYACPPQTKPEDNYLMPNPDDCTTFYQCVWGRHVLQTCPPGLLFDRIQLRCEWPAAATCP